jgi:hypothetical protein
MTGVAAKLVGFSVLLALAFGIGFALGSVVDSVGASQGGSVVRQ